MMLFFDEAQDAHATRRSPTAAVTSTRLSPSARCETLKLMSWVTVTLVSIAWQWLPSFDIGPLERQAKKPPARQEHAPERTTLSPPERPVRLAQLSDETVLRALDDGRAAFVRCWTRALNADPMLDATKVTVRVELDAVGNVVSVTTDAPSAKLGNCLALVARGLSFAASGAPAVAEFPLFFKPE
jgi:hypothetical protein